MKIITRTILGSALQTAKYMGLPYELKEHTTLNERFDIQAGIKPVADVYPDVQYYCIGIGGHRTQVGPDAIPFTSPIQHRASDFALFKHLPFVLRELDDDLTVAQRAAYGLRKIETHDGRTYAAYYLKRMDLTQSDVELRRTVNSGGVVSTTPFVANNSNLNPSQPEINPVGVVTTTGDYLSTSAIIPIIFNAFDVTELVNVANVLYNNESMAVISEIGLCSGVDKYVQGPGVGNTTINYEEVIGCQICTHMTTYYPVSTMNNGFETQIELGATEPMIGVNTAQVI